LNLWKAAASEAVEPGMNDHQDWVDLSTDDFRKMLIALIGYRFGREPEKHLVQIREERSGYMKKFMKMARVSSADTVLELGSGCGFGTRALAQKAGSVIACDISPAFLSYAEQELRDLNNVEFQLVKSRSLSMISDRSIDKVVSTSVFIHFNLYDIYLYLEEFSRVLKSKGKVIFDFSNSHLLAGWIRQQRSVKLFLEHANFYAEDPSNLPGLVQWNTAKAISNVAKMAGFRLQKRRGHCLLFVRAKR
jgi:ubiquinone/menaquinone biosynthesis C-methylase UbiE